MPCQHKFHQYLNLERIDFEPTTLIIGTFNPSWPLNNQAEWFYGRTDNNTFWDVLPRLYQPESLIDATPAAWKQFCHDKKVAITDLISCINDADEDNPQHRTWLGDYTDTNIATRFFNHTATNIVQLLQNHPTILNVYLTRGADGTFWKCLWRPVKRYCEAVGITCKTLFTPSGNARFQHGLHNQNNPDNQLGMGDYILMRWQQGWHQI